MRSLVVLAMFPACMAVAQVRIEWPAQSRVAPGPLHLGDVARLSGPELEPVRQLTRLPLGLVPRSGDPLVLDRAQIDALVRRRAGSALGLQWDGPVTTRIEVLAPAWAVRRGEWAQLQADSGAVRAELRVEVLQDGRPGDRVLVRHAAGGPAVRGRVLDAGVLELLP